MLENWCWDPSILRSLSRYYSYLSPEYKDAWGAENPESRQPQEKAPLELLEGFAKTRNMRGASKMMQLLALSKFDMLFHSASSVKEAEKMDLAAIHNRIRREVTGLCGPEVDGMGEGWGAGHVKFEHVFQGYDAGYYSYVV